MVLLYSKQPGNSRQIPDEANLGMIASAISQAIRKLENHYGVKLLNRTTRSLTPTAEGRQLQQYARQLTD